MIEFRNVSFSYPDGADGGLKNIDITIPDGQCVLLCGRSGCGKTTLTRLLNGLIPQFFAGEVIAVIGQNGADKTTFSRALCGLHRESAGEYRWDGKTQTPKERMKRSYMVMQDVNYQLFAENVSAECTFGIKQPDTALAERVLEELGLAAYRERHPNTLSGGQKQRLAAAGSMVCGKELLVFDEPTSGLDYDSMGFLH